MTTYKSAEQEINQIVHTTHTEQTNTFNYTEWRRGLWNDMTLEQVYAEAVAHYNDN